VIAAIVRGSTVVNVIDVVSLDVLEDPAWADELDGVTVVRVASGEAVGPGYAYDPGGSPRFEAPPVVAAPPTPVNVLAELSVVAADDSKTLDQKLTQIVQILAAAGAPRPNPQGAGASRRRGAL
jgi:hypothetical protein